jgi:chromosome segregation ATPase
MYKLYVMLLIALAGFCFSVSATADEGLKKGLAKAQYMLRQANAEKVAMKQQFDAEKKAAEENQKELAKAGSSLKKAERRIAKLEGSLAVWKDEYEKLKETLAVTRLHLAKMQRYSSQQEDRFTTLNSNFELCEKQNDQLVSMGFSLLEAYESKGLSEAVKQNDPFFGLKKVEIENLVQDYQHQIEDLSLDMNKYLVKKVPQLSELTLN